MKRGLVMSVLPPDHSLFLSDEHFLLHARLGVWESLWSKGTGSYSEPKVKFKCFASSDP